MKVIDDFLPEEVFEKLQKYCYENEFSIVQAGEKEFSVLTVPPEIIPFIEIPGYDIVLTFIRNAYKEFDNTERIHCDGIIMNRKIDLASVLYLNHDNEVSENGTKFYSHQTHGSFLSEDADENEFNRLITEDAADLSKWTETEYINSKPNRLLKYNANYFHGKYPATIEKGVRIVLVIFYSKSN